MSGEVSWFILTESKMSYSNNNDKNEFIKEFNKCGIGHQTKITNENAKNNIKKGKEGIDTDITIIQNSFKDPYIDFFKDSFKGSPLYELVTQSKTSQVRPELS